MSKTDILLTIKENFLEGSWLGFSGGFSPVDLSNNKWKSNKDWSPLISVVFQTK